MNDVHVKSNKFAQIFNNNFQVSSSPPLMLRMNHEHRINVVRCVCVCMLAHACMRMMRLSHIAEHNAIHSIKTNVNDVH